MIRPQTSTALRFKLVMANQNTVDSVGCIRTTQSKACI